MGGYAVHVQGMSELVRYHQAIFLTPLEKEIVPLRPEETRLVSDPSPEHRQTRLYIETLLRRTPPVHQKIAIGHRGALEVMPYQLVPAERALASLRPRILIADGTGLGKTVEMGILLTELIKRGRGRRILVVAIRSMLAQLQRELWARFTLPFVRLDSEGLARVQAKIPSNRNPFSYFDRCIVSVDTLKNHGMYRAWLEQIRWDAIVVDECHNVANRGSQRGDLARLLASQCDALILTSATPHNGRPESFANLMRMLDPTSVANPKSFGKEDVAHLYVRRFKKDIEREAGGQLQDRDTQTYKVSASKEDEAALAALHALSLSTLGRRNDRVDPLVKWTLVKAYLSSPDAALESLEHRIDVTTKALGTAEDPHPRAARLKEDLIGLEAVKKKVEASQRAGTKKLTELVAQLKNIGFDGSSKSPRVVLFSERIRTLDFLETALKKEFKLPDERVGIFTAAAGDDRSQRELVESFGHIDSPLRVLLCSDAASEGINLHHQCNHLFHFDVPWSLIRLTQRNGRIDRFGQHKTPHLGYFVLHTSERTADQRVVERLIEKEHEVERQLGDPGSFLGLYDADSEDDFLTRGVARGKSERELLPDAPVGAEKAARELHELGGGAEGAEPEAEQDGEVDLLALFEEVRKEAPKTPDLSAMITETPTLFANDYELLTAALRHVEKLPVIGPEPLKWTSSEKEKTVTIRAPEPFRRHREVFLPREAVPNDAPYQLVMGRELVGEKLRTALDDEGRWPDWHLLWEQHPLVEWLLDALGAAYARGQAPLLVVPDLGKDATIFLVQGMLYNRESEPVESEWLGIPVRGKTIDSHTLPLAEVIRLAGLSSAMVNRGSESARAKELQALVPQIIAHGKERLAEIRKKQLKEHVVKRARTETRRVAAWVEASLALLEEQRARYTARNTRVPRHIEERLTREARHIEHVQKNHAALLSSLAGEGEPYLRLVAAFTGN
jgi:ERCC4-related helicase